MAFSTPNFREAWSAETTVTFLRKLTFATRMNGVYDGDVMNAARVFVQKPEYGNNVARFARNADWEDPIEGSAGQLTIEIDKYERTSRVLNVQDEIENVVRDYRGRYQTKMLHDLRVSYEDAIVAYILALSTGEAGAGDVNGGAGAVRELRFSAANTGFAFATGKPTGNNNAQGTARQWVLDFFTDATVQLFRQDIDITEMNPMIGSGSSSFWCALPIELYIYGLARELEDKGVTREQIQRNVMNAQINGGAYGGNYRGFDIFLTNALARPASATAGWNIIAGSNSAVAAPMRPVRNYVTEPQNYKRESYVFRHVMEYGLGLVNSELIVLGKIGSGGVLA